jgi:DNA-binding PadR family transcriptional regulator
VRSDSTREAGFVQNGELDRRTNYYGLTGAGRQTLADRRA